MVLGKSQIGGVSNVGGLFFNWVDCVIGLGDLVLVDLWWVLVWLFYICGECILFYEFDCWVVFDGVDFFQDVVLVWWVVYEVLGFVVCQFIELSGVLVVCIVVVGGGIWIQFWMQVIVDVIGWLVEVFRVVEGVVLGVVFFGCLVVGLELLIVDVVWWVLIDCIVEFSVDWVGLIKECYCWFLVFSGLKLV